MKFGIAPYFLAELWSFSNNDEMRQNGVAVQDGHPGGAAVIELAPYRRACYAGGTGGL